MITHTEEFRALINKTRPVLLKRIPSDHISMQILDIARLNMEIA